MKYRRQSKSTENARTGGTGSLSARGLARQESARWAILLAAAVIVLAAIAAYHNSFAGPFIFDDYFWIVENTSIRHLSPIWQVLFPRNAALVGGRPVLSLTLAVNYALGGMDVWGYHAINLASHILAALMLLGVVRRTLILPCLRERFGPIATPLALAATLLWMLHPLQTEAVTYVIQRTESLMGLFYLLVLYCVIRGAASNRATLWYIAATAACLLGMATKEVMATAPLIVLLYDRTFLAGSFREAWRRRYGLYLALLATWGVVVALVIFTGFYGGSSGFAVQKFTWWSYLLTQPGVIVRYLRLMFWPAGLCLDYGWRAPHTVAEVVLPGLLVVALLGLTIWALVKRPAWGLLGAWFFVILAPTSSFMPIKDAAFEHRTYLSLAAVATGVVVGASAAGQWLVRRGMIPLPLLKITGGSLAISLTLALGILTFQRNADYRSDLSISADTVAKAPDNERAHNNLGTALVDCRRIDEAVAEYQKALEINPDYAKAHYNLGAALYRQRKISAAIAQWDEAIRVQPDNLLALNQLAFSLATSSEASVRDGARAVELARRAAQFSGGRDANILATLAAAYAEAGRFPEAVQTANKALVLASRQNNSTLADTLRARLKLYQNNSPYHETQQPLTP